MKTTVLIYKEVDGIRKLVVATTEEWNAILKANRGLPMKERRLFEESRIEENGDLDRMFIEVDYEMYKEWHRKAKSREMKRRSNSGYEVLSLDAPVQEADVNDLHEYVPSEFNLEQIAEDNVLMFELRRALEAWKPWAADLLPIYLERRERTCNMELCQKFGLKERMVRYRKEQFEQFVKDFLK